MLRISKISFPGFGIGEFSIDSVAFKIGSFEIAWYALIIAFGMVLAATHIIYRGKQSGLSPEVTLDFILITIPVGVIGARLYYVLAKIEQYDSFKEVLAIRDGGLAIYGGILAGALSVFLICRYKKISFFAFADICTPGILFAQGIGRWGNFANGEAFGSVTDIFCRMGVSNQLTGNVLTYVHPTFLYESLWNVIGFIIANIFYKKRKYDGQIFFFIFAWYGFGRMFIEGLRADSLYASIFGLEFRVSQVLAAALFILFASALIYFKVKKTNKELYFYKDKKKTNGEK